MSYYCVPDFEMNEDYSVPTSSTLPRSINSPIRADEEIMELVWENGQIVMQSHNQRPPLLHKRPPLIGGEDGGVAPAAERREIRSESTITDDQLFMQEDEMAFWLHHYPTDLYSDEIDPVAPIQELRISPPSQPRRSDAKCSDRIQNFVHFSRPKARTDQGPSILNKAVKESTVVYSCETGAYEMTSSSGDSERVQKKPSPTAEERKRKGREGDTSEWAGEDVEFESPDAKKQNCSPTYAKKSRVSEVHSLSERRRQDRINEKMRALQELIPRCNKSDKASLLDEAIEYLKSLQLQVQMMYMGYSMVPMMFPGVQQYMPPMGMAMGMGTSLPMLPFPSVLASSTLPTPAAAAHLGPRLPVPAFHMPSVPLPGPSNQSDPVLKSLGPQNLNQPRMMNFPGPYPQYVGLHRTQLPMPQPPESSNGAAKYQSAEYQQGG